MRKMSIDIETRSEADLKKVGAYAYATHPSTGIMCIFYKITVDGVAQPTKGIIPMGTNDILTTETMPQDFLEAWVDPETELHAFNETFERVLLQHNTFLTLPKVHFTRWHCTMVRAYYYNLPADLKTCAKVLGLHAQKDEEGKRVMLQLAKVRKPSKTNPDGYFSRAKYPEKYEILYKYCDQDVEVEDAISAYLAPIPQMEQTLFNLDKEINSVGLYIDMPAIEKAIKVSAISKKALRAEFIEMTTYEKEVGGQMVAIEGLTPGQGAKYIEYVFERYGLELTNMRAETVDQIMRKKDSFNPQFIKELEVRSKATKTALAKLDKFKACATADQRIHGALQFYGASATGRWAGRPIQPQNLPSRNIRKDMDNVFKNLMKLSPVDFYNFYKGEDVVKTLSSCLRGFIIPPPNHAMFMIDYSAIEGRVVAWLGDVTTDLEAFRAGLCVYREFGKQAYGMTHEEAHAMPKGGPQRQAMKACILSLGYGVGHDKLGGTLFDDSKETVDIRCKPDTCFKDESGRLIHNCEANRLVKLYRATRPKVKQMWEDMMSAVFAAMKDPGSVHTAGPFKFVKRGIFLHMRIPSGRVLRYPGAEVNIVEKWGRDMPEFSYRGESTAKKNAEEVADKNFSTKWRIKRMYGAKFFQNGAQAIARDIMAEAMLRVQRSKKVKISLTVHDEIVGIFKKGTVELSEIEDMMIVVPDWCTGLPLAVEGEIVERYKK